MKIVASRNVVLLALTGGKIPVCPLAEELHRAKLMRPLAQLAGRSDPGQQDWGWRQRVWQQRACRPPLPPVRPKACLHLEREVQKYRMTHKHSACRFECP